MTDDTNPTPPAADQDPTPPAADPTPTQATYTQADIDRIVKERLTRERQKYQDYDQLKAAADKLKALEEAQLSEQEKLQKRLAELEQKAAQAQAHARETSIRSAVIAEAAKLGFNDPTDAYRLLNLAAVELDDNGEVKNASELVKTLAEQRKYLVKSGQSLTPFDPGGEAGKLRETDDQRRARIFGGGGNAWFDPDRAPDLGGGVIWPKGKPE